MSPAAPRPLRLPPDELGEGVAWVNDELWRVDILDGEVLRTANPLAGEPAQETLRFRGEVGFALPRINGGMVVGVERRIELIDAGGARQILVELDEPTDNRFNDAICDARGRLWAGTCSRSRTRGNASLYRIDPDGSCEPVLRGCTISNGLDWLADGSVLHYVDSPAQRLDALDVDVESGRLAGRRTVARIDPTAGAPDGLTTDAEDMTWVALFGGGAIRRYAPSGALEAELRVPIPHPTNVALGGPCRRDLFITTTRHRLNATQRTALPDAGRVWHVEVDTPGRATLPFAG